MVTTIGVVLDEREREACDEMRRHLGLASDADLLLAALYKLALWCEPDVDPALFRLHRRGRLGVHSGRGES